LEALGLLQVLRRKGQKNIYQFNLNQLKAAMDSGKFTGADAAAVAELPLPGDPTIWERL